jgi:hypothetical protein
MSRQRSILQVLDNVSGHVGSSHILAAIEGFSARLEPVPSSLRFDANPREQVLVLSAVGKRKLHGRSFPPQSPAPRDAVWYYDLEAEFTDLTGSIPGRGKLKAVLSWFVAEVGPVVFDLPDRRLAGPPFDAPPANGYRGVKTNADTLGTTKTELVFPDGSTLVTIGVNQTKVIPMQDGSANLFETNTEVIASGSGRFEGARGLVTSDLGALFRPLVPLDPAAEPFKSGYECKVLVTIRLTTAK